MSHSVFSVEFHFGFGAIHFMLRAVQRGLVHSGQMILEVKWPIFSLAIS